MGRNQIITASEPVHARAVTPLRRGWRHVRQLLRVNVKTPVFLISVGIKKHKLGNN